MSDSSENRAEILALTAQIVSAHVSKNNVPRDGLPELISAVFRSLSETGVVPAEPAKPEPAVPVKRSIFPDYIVCLEDGKKLKMLKRHLHTSYQMTPDQYRHRWGLPADYPMVAPNYAAVRSSLAKKIGLGRAAPAPVAPPVRKTRKTAGKKASA
jgi:predicted transcriptional regulator